MLARENEGCDDDDDALFPSHHLSLSHPHLLLFSFLFFSLFLPLPLLLSPQSDRCLFVYFASIFHQPHHHSHFRDSGTHSLFFHYTTPFSPFDRPSPDVFRDDTGLDLSEDSRGLLLFVVSFFEEEDEEEDADDEVGRGGRKSRTSSGHPAHTTLRGTGKLCVCLCVCRVCRVNDCVTSLS